MGLSLKNSLKINSVGFNVTENCNLRCEYCFVKKNPVSSDKETARKALDWLVDERVSGDFQSVLFSFFGGEPLLEKDIIIDLIEYRNSKYCKGSKQVDIGITTNGIGLTKEFITYLYMNKVGVLISIDGPEHVNDQHRKFVDGKGSFSYLIKNLDYLLGLMPGITARMSITKTTVPFLFESVRFLVEDLGFYQVACTPVTDSYQPWEEKSVQVYKEQLQLLEDWISTRVEKRIFNPVCDEYINRDIKYLLMGFKPDFPCQAGRTHFGISPDGGVYPCHRFLFPEYKVGNVDSYELNTEKLKVFRNFSRDFDKKCKNCSSRVCGGYCFASAYEKIGCVSCLDEFDCAIRKLIEETSFKLYNKYYRDSFLRVSILRNNNMYNTLLSQRFLLRKNHILFKRVLELQGEKVCNG